MDEEEGQKNWRRRAVQLQGYNQCNPVRNSGNDRIQNLSSRDLAEGTAASEAESREAATRATPQLTESRAKCKQLLLSLRLRGALNLCTGAWPGISRARFSSETTVFMELNPYFTHCFITSSPRLQEIQSFPSVTHIFCTWATMNIKFEIRSWKIIPHLQSNSSVYFNTEVTWKYFLRISAPTKWNSDYDVPDYASSVHCVVFLYAHFCKGKPITVAARSKGMNCLRSLALWDRGFESHSTHGCLCVRLFCVCVVLCVGSGLATGWSPAQGVLSSV
jgi:hypothetical protein